MLLTHGHPDIVVVGSGIIGAACAEALSAAGLRVTVLDRGPLAGGTTAAGEGNILLSDKAPGPELRLAQASLREWPRLLRRLAEELPSGTAEVEWEPKGGLVAATDPADLPALRRFAAAQRAAGVDARELTGDQARDCEPLLSPHAPAAVFYPQDAQLQPVLAATALLAAVRRRGGRTLGGVEARGVRLGRGGRITALRTVGADGGGVLPCGAVLNACGPWAGRLAAACGAPLPVQPRRGTVLVTGALPEGTIRHKVYDAGYTGAVGSADAGLRISAVVESTAAGTVLIGSSRQRIGFDGTIRADVLRALAVPALRLFPALARVPVIRAYGGFRPYVPDHLPVIGDDPRRPGLWHATGHEGAGIGLAAGTARLLTELLTGAPTHLDPAPFRIDRPALLGTAATPDKPEVHRT